MQFALPFPFAMSDSFSKIGQVLKHHRTARGSTLNNAFGEDMVTIPVETHLLVRQLFEMPFGRLRSFGLQVATETERPPVNLFPVARAKKLTLRGDSRTIQAQIDPHNGLIGLRNGLRNSNHHMQPPCSFAPDQISGGNGTATIALTEMRHRKRETRFSLRGGDTNGLRCPIEGIGVNIVTNGALLRGRATNRLEGRNRFALLLCLGNLFGIGCFLLGFPGKSATKGFGGFDTSLDKQVTHQTRAQGFRLVIGRMVKPDPILLAVLPSIGTHMIISERELCQRLLQGLRLFGSGLKLDSNRPLHTRSVPYMYHLRQ